MQKSFIRYPDELLPSGFKYPKRYLQLSKGINFPEGLVWWFDDAETEGGKLSWDLRLSHKEWKNIGARNLIPFSQLNDDAAFFDGDDLSGNPRVIVIDLGNKNRTYEEDDFGVWLAQALKDSSL